MNIALITGASSGLGEEFVRQLNAEEYDEIWAIARRKERLEALQNVTSVKVRPISMDLTSEDARASLKTMLDTEQPHVRLLINAAGFGKIGPYEEISRDDANRMVELNCKAAMDITYMCIPYMGRKDMIIEICSTAGFQPFQQLNVYAATKAFLYRFSRALQAELFPQHIHVTAVCPYWIKDTEFIPTAKKTEGSGRAIRHFPFASKKRSVVKLSLRAARIGFPVCTPGIVCTIHRIAAKFVPSFIMIPIWELIRRI